MVEIHSTWENKIQSNFFFFSRKLLRAEYAPKKKTKQLREWWREHIPNDISGVTETNDQSMPKYTKSSIPGSESDLNRQYLIHRQIKGGFFLCCTESIHARVAGYIHPLQIMPGQWFLLKFWWYSDIPSNFAEDARLLHHIKYLSSNILEIKHLS